MIIKIKSDRTQDLWKILPHIEEYGRAGKSLLGFEDCTFIVIKEITASIFLGERYLCFWGVGSLGDVGCFEIRQRNYENLRDFEYGKVQERRY